MTDPICLYLAPSFQLHNELLSHTFLSNTGKPKGHQLYNVYAIQTYALNNTGQERAKYVSLLEIKQSAMATDGVIRTALFVINRPALKKVTVIGLHYGLLTIPFNPECRMIYSKCFFPLNVVCSSP